MMGPRIAWLSASLFLLPVMKLRVVRGMVEGSSCEGGMEEIKEGRWFDDQCG